MRATRVAILSLVLALIATACGSPAQTNPNLSATIDSAVKGTVDAQPSRTPIPASATPRQVPATPSDTPVSPDPPTATSVSSTALSPKVSVSVATNCRTGPGISFPYVSSFEPGQESEVAGRSSEGDYWYIVDPDQTGKHCWIWGNYATVVGDVSALPVLTPEAPPAPRVDFTLYRHSFTECGLTRVSLIVVNNGLTTFSSSRVQIRDVTATNNIYGPNTDNHPFGDNPSSCPKDKGSETLPPGATAYLVIPMKDFKSGNEAAAYVNLCTEDDGKGTCVTKSAYFRLPAD
jgi:hypothetical protein